MTETQPPSGSLPLGTLGRADRAFPPLGSRSPAPFLDTAAYRGWSVSFDYGCFHATGPNFDASWEGEEDGWVGSSDSVSARTLDGLHGEIDAWIEEQAA